MKRCEETDGTVKNQAISIVLDLVIWLIPHSGSLPVALLFLQQMAVYLLVISLVFTITVCT